MKKISILIIVSLFLFTSSAFADTTSDLYKVADGITGTVQGSGNTSTATTAGQNYSQLTFGREKLKGTDKTTSDFKKPTTPTTTKRLTCSNCVCDCTVPDTTSTAPATTPAPATKAATGKGTTGGGGTIKAK
jgi:hypothetical protein